MMATTDNDGYADRPRLVAVDTQDLIAMLAAARIEVAAPGAQEAVDGIRDTLRFILHDAGAVADEDIAGNDGANGITALPVLEHRQSQSHNLIDRVKEKIKP